ncbi:MAG: PIN domain-containing protein, partial [bacterium]
MERKDFYILDGSALLYRSHFAFINNPLRNSSGEPTSAIYGFLISINKLIADKKVNYLAVVFDAGKPTFRHELYKEYKSQRPPMP